MFCDSARPITLSCFGVLFDRVVKEILIISTANTNTRETITNTGKCCVLSSYRGNVECPMIITSPVSVELVQVLDKAILLVM